MLDFDNLAVFNPICNLIVIVSDLHLHSSQSLFFKGDDYYMLIASYFPLTIYLFEINYYIKSINKI